MAPTLTKVIRLDSLPLGQTYFTPEGYLRDRPILTTTGIFEYLNSDGSVRRELRLPDEVFAPESLASYQGKPIIITHDAGLVTTNNVHEEQIGTILTEGYRNGNDVRAEIVIHDTDAMKDCGLKELSLGYNLDLDETPGEWNGQHYDAIQRNIRINHLALVREARAGETARLNIDSRDNNFILKGGKAMSKKTNTSARRADGVFSPEELEKAIEEYKTRRAARKADEDEPVEDKIVSTEPGAGEPAKADTDPVGSEEGSNVEEQVEQVKDRKDRRDSQADPATVEEANDVIVKQDEDIELLLNIIDTLLAEREFNAGKKTDEEEKVIEEIKDAIENKNESDGDLGDKPVVQDGDDCDDKKPSPAVNADSVDAIIRQRVKIGMIGRTLNMDGLEDMNIYSAKKAIIKAVRPGVRLDGRSNTFIDAMFECACDEVKARPVKDTGYQKKQMFNRDGRDPQTESDSALSARERMIARQKKKKED